MNSRNIALSILIATLLAVLWGNNQNRRIEARLEALEADVQWCIWNHDNHNTKAIKGSKQADNFRKAIGRPSDDGGC